MVYLTAYSVWMLETKRQHELVALEEQNILLILDSI